ncbi:RING/FYVE/PHD zinc finger superfamily protein [Raphanus sativus]|uniref:Uncharacterized protein LOC108838159 n=1 Tax=Raphanus sativus TaxID=3726 RepID=A0A6J0M3N9_RAPSA|nr:uncharacterized protein LOC108838159 [Raphanus sativus]KAJ4887732.1 RING/FYVE/PHD zinc finger superfamily protein [Raphanus sativus]
MSKLNTLNLYSTTSLTTQETLQAIEAYPTDTTTTKLVDDKEESDEEEEPLIQQSVECRICQEEDSVKNLESPCSCSGSLKYAHRKCVQRWCNEKGDTICEICHKSHQPGYTAPPPPPPPDDTVIDIGEDWANGVSLYLNDPRILAMAAAERHFFDADSDEYADTNSSGAAFLRSAALILMALLLLQHAMNLSNNNSDDQEDDDPSAFFFLFMLRAAGFLLPCYIMAWTISILQRRRQRQEAAALAAAEVAFMLHSGGGGGVQHRGGLHYAVAPELVPSPQQHQPESSQ